MADHAYDHDAVDDTTWFLANARDEEAGPRLIGLCRELVTRQSTLMTNTEKCMAVFQWGGDAKDANPADHFPIEDTLVTFNAARNTIETVHAKVCKPRIAPMPLTEGGGYLQRQRAKELGKAIEGVLAENEVDSKELDVVYDAMTTDHGAGAVMCIDREDDIEIRFIPIEDVWFDESEVRYREPRSCYYIPKGGIDMYVALEYYGDTPEKRDAIRKAASRPEAWRVSTPGAARRVDLFEAWHLPSGNAEELEEEYDDEETGEKKSRKVKRHDGRHVIAVAGSGGTLVDEPWCEDHFPILLSVPRPRRRSIWGLSLMRDLIAPQREYEKVGKKIQSQNQKMGISGFVARRQDEINFREITAGTFAGGFIAETNQDPPTPLIIDPVAAQTYAYYESIPRNMSERNGMSTLATASQIPAGMQGASGKALQVYEDFEDVRLLPYHRERESFKVRLSMIICHAAKRIVDRGKSFKARYRGKKGLEVIDWKEVLEDFDTFVMRVFPVSELSKQPAAKFAQLTEMLDRGAINVEQFKRLYELPDLESENEIDTADTDIIDRSMDLMVTKGRYLPPEPFDNLDLIIQRAGKFYNLCRQQEVPEARLQLLRNYMQDARSLIKQAKDAAAEEAAANAPPPMPMGGPPGMPPPMPMPPGPPGMVPPAGPLPGMPDAGPMPPPAAPPMPMAA